MQDISLCITKGDFVGIIGKNRRKKHTFKLMLGQLKPQSGNVFLNETTKVGYVEQVTISSDNSFPASVLEVVMLGLYNKIGMFKFANKHHKAMAQNALKMVGARGFWKKQLSFLSGGQQQRVIIAKALVSNPDLLILDEPTTGIDAHSEKEFISLLHHLNKGHGKTIVMVTHNFDKLSSANKIYIVEDCKLLERKHV